MMSWDCPNCGHAGNLKKFCGMCGCKRPESAVAAEPVLEQDASEQALTSSEEIVEQVQAAEPVITPEPEKQTSWPTNGSQQMSAAAKRKRFVIAGCTILVLCVGFLIFKLAAGNDYQAVCQSLAEISSEVGKSKAALGELAGNPAAAERQAVTDSLQKNIESLDKLHDELRKIKPPADDESAKYEALAAIIEYDKSYLSAVKDIVNYDTRDLGDMSNYTSEEYDNLHKRYISVFADYDSLEPLIISIDDKKSQDKEVAAQSLVLRDEIDTALGGYLNRKAEQDKAYLAELKQAAEKKLAAEKVELKGKDEVVFLVNRIRKGSGNNILIDGVFYNGTKDNVSAVKEHLLDISLKAFDAEVYSIKDVKIPVSAVVSLSPGATSQPMTINYTVKGQKVPYFTTAEVDIHKIRWVVRRLVTK